MANTPHIEDAGEKLWGARKDMATSTSTASGGAHQEPLLEILWPKPAQWTDLVPSLGAHRAALVMVTYENLAKKPHRHGWLKSDGAHWERAYRFGIPILQSVLMQPGKPDLEALRRDFDTRMRAFEDFIPTPPHFPNQWSYAIGSAGTRTNRHPFDFTPIDGLRSKYLGEWGWGTDPRVGNSLSMGAISLKNRFTGQRFWMAVKGASGRWIHLDERKFESEQEAIECAREKVTALLGDPQRGAKRQKLHNWIRPHVAGEAVRTGFASPNAQGKTQIDLLETFGFRGVEFGNWVSQPERQQFVDAAYDAFLDLTQLLGMPPLFASLNGKLGLAFGSRGKGLSKAAAHFEPGSWVLHFTKESGPGSIAHEFGHAMDAWIADRLWGHLKLQPRYGTGWPIWGTLPPSVSGSPTARAIQALERPMNHRVSTLEWVRQSVAMDTGRTTRYWSDPSEIFARAFEVLVMDSLQAMGRHNNMLVCGISNTEGMALAAAGKRFPYPVGPERKATCEAIAPLVRAYRNEFRQAMTLTNQQPV